MSEPPEDDMIHPKERSDQIGRRDVEGRIRQIMNEGALNNGWIIAGAEGAGKATLAYRIARALLAPTALNDADTLEMSADARTFRLVANGAHPDLFVAERLWDEKKSRYQAEISVETIRNLTSFLNRTASAGGHRVAIVDTADDMNRNGANALLKILEEPPARTTLLLLSATPGRLLATIRSRCRRIDLRPVADNEIAAFLIRSGLAAGNEADAIAAHASGRPGYAARLAAGDGAAAISLVHQFLESARNRGDTTKVTNSLTGKAGDERWRIFREVVSTSLTDAARRAAMTGAVDGPLAGASANALVDAHEKLGALLQRGEALNLDRAQLIGAMAHDLRSALAA